MQPSRIGARRRCAGLAAAGLAALLAAFGTPASAGALSAQEVRSDARLRAGQSWEPPKFSITDMRPGTVEQGHFEKYIREVSAKPAADTATKSEAASRTTE